MEDALAIVEKIGYPVLVRPSFVLGGRGMVIVYKEKYLRKFVEEAAAIGEGKPILIDRFLEDATELDVDCISDGKHTVVGAIMEHVEPAGIHSGDSASVIPPMTLSKKIQDKVRAYAKEKRSSRASQNYACIILWPRRRADAEGVNSRRNSTFSETHTARQ